MISDNTGTAQIQAQQKIGVQWLQSVDDIPDDLWQKCFPPPLEGRWWYSVLENSELNDQFKFFYGLLIRDSKPIGIAPVFVMDMPMDLVAPGLVAVILQGLSKIAPALGYQRTIFIGSPCAEEGSVGLLPEVELAELAQPLHSELLKKAQILKATMLVWKDFPASAENALDSLCNSGKVFKTVSYPGTLVLLKEASTKSYFSSLKSSHRHNLQKKLKRSQEILPLDISVIQNPDNATLDEIFALFWQTYEHGKIKFERLNQTFFTLISQQKESWFVLLRQKDGGKLVAFMLCFLVGDRIINKFIGLDYAIARQGYLYFRLWYAAVEWMTASGIKEIQSGQTGYRFKLDVGNSLVPLTNYCQHVNPLINFVYAHVAKTISWSTLDEDLNVYLKAHPKTIAKNGANK